MKVRTTAELPGGSGDCGPFGLFSLNPRDAHAHKRFTEEGPQRSAGQGCDVVSGLAAVCHGAAPLEARTDKRGRLVAAIAHDDGCPPGLPIAEHQAVA